MYLLLIFLWFKSGAVDVRSSIVYNVYEDTHGTCEEALPLTIKLYKTGKFDDGPMPILLKKVTGRCEPVVDDEKLVSE